MNESKRVIEIKVEDNWYTVAGTFETSRHLYGDRNDTHEKGYIIHEELFGQHHINEIHVEEKKYEEE